MHHVLTSFRKHRNERGCHFYNDEECSFLPWMEVIQITKKFPDSADVEFTEKLVEALSNYDPKREYLAVQQKNSRISVEIYSEPNNERIS